MGNPYIDMLHGLVIGHIYYFLVDVIPAVYGKDVLQTPRFLIDYFGVGQYQPPTSEPAPNNNAAGRFGAVGGRPAGGGGAAAAAGGGGGHHWGGTGQRLGTN